MKIQKNRKQKKARSIEAFTAIFLCKGGPMRDRRERRAKDARRKMEEME